MLVQTPLDLSQVFDLRFRDTDVFEGDSPPYAWGAAYGGLLVAQAQWAATQTVPEEFHIHSLHAYFVQAGSLHEPVRYRVERVRDGRSFRTRRVLAMQSVGEMLSVICSFHKDEPGPSWQEAELPDDVPEPDAIEGHWDAGLDRRDAVFENEPPRVATWMRFPDALGDDPRLHACAISYLSDLNPIDAGVAAHPTPPVDGQWSDAHVCLSLDHAVWFHRPARGDEWLLLDSMGRRFSSTRAFASGTLYTQSGEHVATIAQEGLFRSR